MATVFRRPILKEIMSSNYSKLHFLWQLNLHYSHLFSADIVLVSESYEMENRWSFIAEKAAIGLLHASLLIIYESLTKFDITYVYHSSGLTMFCTFCEVLVIFMKPLSSSTSCSIKDSKYLKQCPHWIRSVKLFLLPWRGSSSFPFRRVHYLHPPTLSRQNSETLDKKSCTVKPSIHAFTASIVYVCSCIICCVIGYSDACMYIKTFIMWNSTKVSVPLIEKE